MRMYTLCACLYVYTCTLYSVFIQANITHSVYPCRLISTLNVISAHDCTYIDSVMQELLFGASRTKVCLGTKEAGNKLKITYTA